jgi:predicted AlkP superfamily pyrophosphatase or phosphodiesterase
MMAKHRKLVVVMIDGLSADYFLQNKERLPCLSEMVDSGFSVTRLRSEIPATSMPGRASIITGVPASQHGVYGNYLHDGVSFRVANPDDINVPTIARRALEAGRDVACVGYAMVRPRDTHVFLPPWWLRGWVQGSRFEKESMKGYTGPNLSVVDPEGRLPSIAAKLPTARKDYGPALEKTVTAMHSDQIIVSAAAALACSSKPPDLILTEIASTDTIQHYYGYEDDVAHWSLMEADLIVGALRARIQCAGRHDDYVIVVVSDHGHSLIQTAIFPDIVIPGSVWQTEGSTLHVELHDGIDSDEIKRRLADHGATVLDNSYMPPSVRNRLASFVAPPLFSFEERPASSSSQPPTGPPRYKSSHGLRPGSAGDDRFCAIVGPGIPHAFIPTASAEQLASTLMKIIGLPIDECPMPPFAHF